MPDSFSTQEINRYKKLLKGRNAPYRIMKDSKEVQYLAKGAEMTSDYVDKCKARWQRGYTKLHPSEVYGNWFNYMLYDTVSDDPVEQNCYKYSSNYTKRKTIESTITTNEVTNKEIVSLINGYTMDNNNKKHLDIYANDYYDKYKAMQHESYSYSFMPFDPNVKNNDYPQFYQDTSCYTGFSICKEFLNSVDGFTISFTIHLNDSDPSTYVSQNDYVPLAIIRIYDSNYQPVKTIGTYMKYTAANNKESQSSYEYGDFFFSVKDSIGETIPATDLYTQQKIYSDVNVNIDTEAVTDVHGSELTGYACESVLQPFADSVLYPHVSITITCDKQSIYLYTNGQFYGSCDISEYLTGGNAFFDSDILFDRTMTVDSTGTITSQTPNYTPYTRLYNLHVFKECLAASSVEKVFGASERFLTTPDAWKTEDTEIPYSVTEKHGPVLNYESGPNVSFDIGESYYVLNWAVRDTLGNYEITRYENITNDIQWTVTDPNVFRNGGTTTVKAQYTNQDLTWNQTYTISVSEPTYIYGFRRYYVKTGEVDPTTGAAVLQEVFEYLEDAVGMEPARMENDSFNYGDWANAFFIPKPCLLKYNGKVAYYLKPNNYNKKVSGATAPIYNVDCGGNVMMEWPLIWYKFEIPDEVPDEYINFEGCFYVSNKQVDSSYKCYCNLDCNGNIIPHFYTSVFNCCVKTATGDSVPKLRSLSDWTMTKASGFGGTTMQEEVTYAKANNTTDAVEWFTDVFCDRQLINALLLLMCKNVDCSAKYGIGLGTYGSSSSGPFSHMSTGALNTYGLFYGDTEGVTAPVKVFGMEGWWGGLERRIAGCVYNAYKVTEDTSNNKVYVKLTYGTQDGSSVTGYLDGSSTPSDWDSVGYVYKNMTGPLQTEYGIMEMKLDNDCMLPTAAFHHSNLESMLTPEYYGEWPYHDVIVCSSRGNYLCTYFRGNDYSLAMGPLSMNFRGSGAFNSVSTGLSCKPLAEQR